MFDAMKRVHIETEALRVVEEERQLVLYNKGNETLSFVFGNLKYCREYKEGIFLLEWTVLLSCGKAPCFQDKWDRNYDDHERKSILEIDLNEEKITYKEEIVLSLHLVVTEYDLSFEEHSKYIMYKSAQNSCYKFLCRIEEDTRFYLGYVPKARSWLYFDAQPTIVVGTSHEVYVFSFERGGSARKECHFTHVRKWYRLERDELGEVLLFPYFVVVLDDGRAEVLNIYSMKCVALPCESSSVVPVCARESVSPYMNGHTTICYKNIFLCVDDRVYNDSLTRFKTINKESPVYVCAALGYNIVAYSYYSHSFYRYYIDVKMGGFNVVASSFSTVLCEDGNLRLQIRCAMAGILYPVRFNVSGKRFEVSKRVADMVYRKYDKMKRSQDDWNPWEEYGLLDGLDGDYSNYWNID